MLRDPRRRPRSATAAAVRAMGGGLRVPDPVVRPDSGHGTRPGRSRLTWPADWAAVRHGMRAPGQSDPITPRTRAVTPIAARAPGLSGDRVSAMVGGCRWVETFRTE